ncbi:class I SAM-dependent methyltransferase [Candidatus Microgenomates bacterium]|nr:class I SAM-dependent methyltransferase [Candidatus Microgenomates bacterium]
MPNHRLYGIWKQVPVTYYQRGVQGNILQRIWHRNKLRQVEKIIRGLTFKTCLDVGCAGGFMISEVARKFPRAKYYGIDAFDRAVAYAKAQYPNITFKTGMAENIPFKDNSFDLILFYETIEHVEHPARALKELRRVLKKDGTVILAMDSGNAAFRVIWYVWEHTYGRVWQNAHLHPFHHTELEKLIRRSGFTIRSKQFTHMGLEVVFVLS